MEPPSRGDSSVPIREPDFPLRLEGEVWGGGVGGLKIMEFLSPSPSPRPSPQGERGLPDGFELFFKFCFVGFDARFVAL
jgi:hypothetical protein